ncbi:hypothetical protein ACYZT4_14665 [Pseudomonas sp. GB2N2]
MLRQLFCSGAVAACNMEILIALPYNDALPGIVRSASVVNTFDAARMTRINLNPYR